MNREQFTFWLKGFLEGKENLSKEEIESINQKMSQIVDSEVFIPWNQPVTPSSPHTWPCDQPYYITCDHIQTTYNIN